MRTWLLLHSRLRRLCVALALVCAPLAAGAQDRVNLNAITRIEVKGNTIEITGSKRPNFTTFTLPDPPRLVIDISEASFQGVPPELKIGDGTVTAIKTATYHSDAAVIARVLIGFEKDLETDIVTSGNALIVKLPSDPRAVAKLTTERVEAERQARAAAEKADQERLEKEKAEREEKDRLAREEKERAAKEKAEAEAKARAEREEKDRLAREEKERTAKEKAEAVAKAKAEKQEKERLAREEKERAAKEKAEAEARAKADREAKLAAEREDKERRAREAEEAKKKEADERAAKARAEREDKERKLREAEEAKKAEEEAKKEQARLAREEKEKKKREAEEQAKQEQARLAREEQERKQREAEEAKKQALLAKADPGKKPKDGDEQRRAEAEKKKKDLEDAAARTPSPGELAGRARMTFVGFRQDQGVGRIFLRTSAPVRYSVGEDVDRNVVVTLENTEIGLPNNQRILDTSFFDTAVSLVRPEETDEHQVKVTITLKKAVAYRASQSGPELTVEFERAE